MTDTANLSLEQRIAGLEAKVQLLERERPGRRVKPNVVKQAGVCGLDPARDSTQCDDASIYRYQQGCRGVCCDNINTKYYKDYRAANRLAQQVVIDADELVVSEPEPEPTPVAFASSRRRSRPRLEEPAGQDS